MLHILNFKISFSDHNLLSFQFIYFHTTNPASLEPVIHQSQLLFTVTHIFTVLLQLQPIFLVCQSQGKKRFLKMNLAKVHF